MVTPPNSLVVTRGRHVLQASVGWIDTLLRQDMVDSIVRVCIRAVKSRSVGKDECSWVVPGRFEASDNLHCRSWQFLL